MINDDYDDIDDEILANKNVKNILSLWTTQKKKGNKTN